MHTYTHRPFPILHYKKKVAGCSAGQWREKALGCRQERALHIERPAMWGLICTRTAMAFAHIEFAPAAFHSLHFSAMTADCGLSFCHLIKTNITWPCLVLSDVAICCLKLWKCHKIDRAWNLSLRGLHRNVYIPSSNCCQCSATMTVTLCWALCRALAGWGRFPTEGDLNSTQEFWAGRTL